MAENKINSKIITNNKKQKMRCTAYKRKFLKLERFVEETIQIFGQLKLTSFYDACVLSVDVTQFGD